MRETQMLQQMPRWVRLALAVGLTLIAVGLALRLAAAGM